MAQTAIITGGRRGIGRAIAVRLSRDGFNVVINGLHSPEENDHFEDITSHGGAYLYIQGDISRSEDRKNLVEKTLEKFGTIHVLVNNAGVAPKLRMDLLDMTEESFDYVMQVNTKANMFLSQIVAKQMLKQNYIDKKRGTIINISSCSAVVSSTNRGEYCVSKAGVSMLTLLYADRLASEGIFVYEIRPGIINTDMTCAVQEKYDAMFKSGVCPIARWGTPEDVADAVSVFSGNDFSYSTGNYIDIDGGFHIRRL